LCTTPLFTSGRAAIQVLAHLVLYGAVARQINTGCFLARRFRRVSKMQKNLIRGVDFLFVIEPTLFLDSITSKKSSGYHCKAAGIAKERTTTDPMLHWA